MARILFVWELGGGLGHVTVLRPVAQELQRRGHQVLLAVRDLCAAHQVFRDDDLSFVQAPFKMGQVSNPFVPQRSFAHLLHHAGLGELEGLTARTAAWNGLFDLVCPDITVFDHSPTALLASRGRTMRRKLLGTGFCAPPVGEVLPDMRPWLQSDLPKLADDESKILAISNRVLRRFGRPAMARLSDIYGQADANLLTSYPELDHFGARPYAQYLGVIQSCPGAKPVWPQGEGRRVFAYLKRTQGLPETIRALGECRHPTIIYAPWVNDEICSRFPFPSLSFSPVPLDMAALVREADVAVLNGTHGATAEFLLAGKPVMQLPIFLEQRLIAQRTEQIGAGIAVHRTRPDEIRAGLNSVLSDQAYQERSQSFSAKYASRDRQQDFDNLVASVEKLAL